MAFPPGEGSISEGASGELDFARFLARADLKDRFGLFEPLHQCNDSPSAIKSFWLCVGELLVSTFPYVTMTSAMVGMIRAASCPSISVGVYL